MADTRRTVLITGCSDGGMGAALASNFQSAGYHVYATARDVKKMHSLSASGIELLPLDISSKTSIEDCVRQITRLDILINNAGAQYTMPIADIDLDQARNIFDANLWGHIAMTQAFLPLLLKSPNAMVVNHTSVGAGQAIPFQAVYNASKSALSMFTDTLRMELKPFGVTVVELRTGGVKTNVVKSLQAKQTKLPEGSIYAPARALVDDKLSLKWTEGIGIPAEQWAKEVVADLSRKNPPNQIWRGESAWMAWFAGMLPAWLLDSMMMRMTGIDQIAIDLRTSQ